MSAPKLTPMMQQYLDIKSEYPDALLFYRMGDFYELFFEDAEITARELQIALTTRNPQAEHKIPMCGVPHHAVDEYLRQLLDKRYKVAICDQMEDPAKAKGLVRREVTRVLTPGTVVDDLSLEGRSDNFLAALFWDKTRGGGLAWADFSTGQWSGIYARTEDRLWQWAVKMAPRELLLDRTMELPPMAVSLTPAVTRVPSPSYFDFKSGRERLLRFQAVASLDILDLQYKPGLVCACGALLSYMQTTQKSDPTHLAPFSPLNLSRFLQLDEVTERNLELFVRMDGRSGPGTLWNALNHTRTPMGTRLLKDRLRRPWKEMGPIKRQQEAVDFFVQDDAWREHLRRLLDEVFDIERLSTRIHLQRAMPRDFVCLRQSLAILPSLLQSLASRPGSPPVLDQIIRQWDDVTELADILIQAVRDNPPQQITEGGIFRRGFDPELDEFIELAEHGQSALDDLLEKERSAHGLPKLKLGFNRVFGHYFELGSAHKGPIPDHFIRRQTLANAERYVTEDLKALEEKLVSASDRRRAKEYELFVRLRADVAAFRSRLVAVARRLAEVDVWQCLAQTARQWEWTRPEVHVGLGLTIRGGRHPAVEECQGRAAFIPNDLVLDERDRLALVTGPNMAGKSTVLRQVAIICILAQIGSFVPAESASLGLCDRVFSRVGASDNLAMGQSTFMVEMIETARILRQAGKRSLVVLDEIGRGTSTFDGLSLAWAVIEELARRHGGIRTLFATHYHELTVLDGKIPGIKNLNIAVKEWGGEIVFLRRLVPGPADRSYGIEVAKLAGVPAGVVNRAREILKTLEDKARPQERSKIRSTSRALPGLGPAGPELTMTSDGPTHPIVAELQTLDTNTLTPLEALTIMSDWKNKWGLK
ncbi:MAG: DNA mismatch repair protein MutS [Deltaproteobacteria bacterium]|nr:DNA mismatch repair protein MutS [Deltaproteobacteria bacterium]